MLEARVILALFVVKSKGHSTSPFLLTPVVSASGDIASFFTNLAKFADCGDTLGEILFKLGIELVNFSAKSEDCAVVF